MIIKIYLVFSLITLVLFVLQLINVIHIAKSKYGASYSGNGLDIAGLVLQGIKIVILSFVPVLNVFMLLSLIFAGDKIQTGVEKLIEEKRHKEYIGEGEGATHGNTNPENM